MDAYRFPEFVKPEEKKPFSEDVKAKFDAEALKTPIRRYRSEEFPQPGYNPNANRMVVRQINIKKDELILPPN